jgi:hypothetical protein
MNDTRPGPDLRSVARVLDRIAGEQAALRLQTRGYEDKRNFRGWWTIFSVTAATIAAIATTIAAVVAIVVSHNDTRRAMRDARIAANTQHNDTQRALAIAAEADKTATATADAQIKQIAAQSAALAAQSAALQQQLTVMKADAAMWIAVLSPKMKLDTHFDPVVENGQTIGWRITPFWTNNGATAALQWKGWDSLYASSSDPPSAFDFTKPHVANTQIPISVPPSATVSQGSLTISEDDLKKSTVIVLSGRVEWQDSFPHTPVHYEAYCFRLIPTAPGWQLPLIYRPECNRAGNN